LPGLRDRRQDLPELAAHLSKKIASRTGVDITRDQRMQKLLDAARDYEWPGNVREFENLIERIAMLEQHADAALADVQLRELVPEIFSSASSGKPTSSIASRHEESEAQLIQRVLDECDGSYAKASEQLGISRTTLWRKLKRGRALS
jgi:transcriptional regulator, propionate catabolism operon regulatory protein